MRKAVKIIAKALLGFVALSMALVACFRWAPVRYTPLMLKRSMQGVSADVSRKGWVPLAEISPEFVRAVITAEDQRFYEHKGFDWEELERVRKIHRQEGTPWRGCSTISQQTAKNVFTFGSPTLLRKALEAYWTVLIEILWGKERILEVYLNVAEMGRGIYGAQTASRYYYGIPACRLDRKQAVALAVCLPQPLILRPDCLGGDERARVKKLNERLR